MHVLAHPWTELDLKMPEGANWTSGAVVGDKVHFVGGQNEDEGALSNHWVIDVDKLRGEISPSR